ncbi:hypothetical protein ACET3Z_031509 [Daucus carota]
MMRKLRLLKLNNVQLSGGYTDFPKKLKWLTWHNFSLRALPNGFPLSSLVAIDMQSSKLQRLVQGNMIFGSLKFLNLSHSHDLVKSPNFAELNALEQLILEDCVSLIENEIDESIGMAEGLVLLDIKDCKLLKRLPKNIYKLKYLQTLIISGCSNIRMLDAEMKNMESLKDFHADGLDFGNSSYRNQKSESWLDFFQGLVSKPRIGPELSLTSLPFNSITLLSLANCNLNNNAFPKDYCLAPSLQYLILSGNPIRFLPDCFKGLERLKELHVRECSQLQALEDLPNIQNFLVALDCPVLEKITFDAPGTVLKGYAVPHGCGKLLEMQSKFKIVPIGDIDSEFIKSCGIYDVEVKKRMQADLSLILSHFGYPQLIVFRKILQEYFRISPVAKHSAYFTLGAVFQCGSLVDRRHLETKDRVIMYDPACYGIPEGDEDMTWLSHWELGSHEVGAGDEVVVSVFTYSSTCFVTKEVGVNVVYEWEEEGGVHLAKRQKMQQTCDRISQFVIPMEARPWAHYGTTQFYFIGMFGPRGKGLDRVVQKTLE